jgi:hypothetical protein
MGENYENQASILMKIGTMTKSASIRRCEFCGHSRAAHTDGVACSLCPCRSERQTFVQQSLAFRDTLSLSRPIAQRKR